jgi:hypothetical protein
MMLIFVVWGFYVKGLLIFWFDPLVYVYEILTIVLLAESLLLLAVILSWINYHLFLHRSKKPRKRIPYRTWDYHTDWLRYTVTADFKALATVKVIMIQVNKAKKTKIYLSVENPKHG